VPPRRGLNLKLKAPAKVKPKVPPRSVCHGGCGEIVELDATGNWHHLLFGQRSVRVNHILDAAHPPQPVVEP
jgi:hypothetical protein